MKNIGWVEAGKLKEGDKLFSKELGDTEIAAVQEDIYLDREVYNLQLEGNHNFFVSELELLVHNDTACAEMLKKLDDQIAKLVKEGGMDETVENLKKQRKEIEEIIAKTPDSKNRTSLEFDDLAKDPAHGNKATVGSILEREVGLVLEKRGDLGYIVRDTIADKGAEFVDTVTGQKWDVKAFRSYAPKGQEIFKVEKALGTMGKEFDKGYNVILDTRNLTEKHLNELIKAIEKKGVSNRVIFYP